MGPAGRTRQASPLSVTYVWAVPAFPSLSGLLLFLAEGPKFALLDTPAAHGKETGYDSVKLGGWGEDQA